MPQPITITQLVNDSTAISDMAILRFSKELENIISDDKIRNEFITAWKKAISEYRTESKNTTGSRLRINPVSTPRPSLKYAALDKLRPPKNSESSGQDVVVLPTPSSEWIVNEEDLRRLAAKFPVKIFGRRSEPTGKRKRGAAGRGALGFDQRTGSYYAEVTDGCLQLSNGLIEIFFSKGEILLDGFYDEE